LSTDWQMTIQDNKVKMDNKKYLQEKGEYLNKNPTWHAEDSPFKAKWILTILRKNNISPNTVVEVGCGAGEILHQLYKKLPDDVEFKGYDIAIDAIKLAKKREQERLSFYHEDFFQTKEYADLLLVIDVFEHVEDCFAFLRSCKNRSKFVVFHIPIEISAQAVVRNRLMVGRKSVGHLHYFMKETALATLADTGFEILDYNYTAGMLELPNKALISKLAAVPRRVLFRINEDFTVRLLGGYSLMVLAK